MVMGLEFTVLQLVMMPIQTVVMAAAQHVQLSQVIRVQEVHLLLKTLVLQCAGMAREQAQRHAMIKTLPTMMVAAHLALRLRVVGLVQEVLLHQKTLALRFVEMAKTREVIRVMMEIQIVGMVVVQRAKKKQALIALVVLLTLPTSA